MIRPAPFLALMSIIGLTGCADMLSPSAPAAGQPAAHPAVALFERACIDGDVAAFAQSDLAGSRNGETCTVYAPGLDIATVAGALDARIAARFPNVTPKQVGPDVFWSLPASRRVEAGPVLDGSRKGTIRLAIAPEVQG